jgi:uncharacterized protein YaaW (UPF0174 family)
VSANVADVERYPTAPAGKYRVMVSFFVKTGPAEWGYVAQAYDIDAAAPTFRQIIIWCAHIADLNRVSLNDVQFLSWSPLA